MSLKTKIVQMPEGWVMTSLGNICFFENGDRGKNYPSRSKFVEAGVPFINAGHLTSGEVDTGSLNYISKESFDRLSNGKIKPGDILFCLRGSLGKCALVEDLEEGAIASSLVIIRSKKTVISKYLMAYFRSSLCSLMIEKFRNGAAQPNLSARCLKEFDIPLPPLPEQKRIVAILDEVFAGIDDAIANTEQNLNNARELFESYLNTCLSIKKDGWNKTNLGKEIDLMTGFPFKSSGYTKSSQSIRLLRGDNVVQGYFRWEDVKRWPISEVDDFLKHQLLDGDVILAMDRPWVNTGLKRAQISKADLPCLLVQRTACLRGGKTIESGFLMHLISSHAFIQHVLGSQTGIGVPHISGKQIKSFEFLKPPFAEQLSIAATLDKLQSETQRLKSVYQQKLTALNELKQSILQKAFTGELTADTATEATQAIKEEIAA